MKSKFLGISGFLLIAIFLFSVVAAATEEYVECTPDLMNPDSVDISNVYGQDNSLWFRFKSFIGMQSVTIPDVEGYKCSNLQDEKLTIYIANDKEVMFQNKYNTPIEFTIYQLVDKKQGPIYYESSIGGKQTALKELKTGTYLVVIEKCYQREGYKETDLPHPDRSVCSQKSMSFDGKYCIVCADYDMVFNTEKGICQSCSTLENICSESNRFPPAICDKCNNVKKGIDMYCVEKSNIFKELIQVINNLLRRITG